MITPSCICLKTRSFSAFLSQAVKFEQFLLHIALMFSRYSTILEFSTSYLSIPLTPLVSPLLFLHTPFPMISGPCRAVCFSLLSCSVVSNSVSFSFNHSTVRLSTVSWFGWSFPLVSSTRLSSNVKVIGVGDGDLYKRKLLEDQLI